MSLSTVSTLAIAQVPGQIPTFTPATNPKVAETYRIGDNAYVRALAVDRKHNSLWVGTSVGAMEVDLQTYNMKRVYTRKEGLANEYVFAVGIDRKGSAWLGTNAGGLSIIKDGEVSKTYFPLHGLADYWVYSFGFTPKNDAWIGTWDGVTRIDGTTGAFTTFRRELINVWVYGIALDPQGRVWFGTEGGVSMYDGRTWRSWTHADGLGAPNYKDLPHNTNTGLGTRSRHDLSISTGAFSESFNPNYVFAVHYDPGSRSMWFGTWGGGVSRLDPDGKWTSYTERDGLAGNIVYSIGQEEDGTLWFGTNRGVTRFDGKSWKTFDRSIGLVNDHVYAVAIGPGGMVWLGTKGGVTRLAYKKI